MEEKEKDEKEEKVEKKSSSYTKPQPVIEKKERPLVATQTCRVKLESGTLELVAGQEVPDLTRQEREHLLFHNFIE